MMVPSSFIIMVNKSLGTCFVLNLYSLGLDGEEQVAPCMLLTAAYTYPN
jgi:hypothetical protein